MRVILLLISALFLSSVASANEAVLKQKMADLKQLQEKVAEKCTGKQKDFKVMIDGKEHTCDVLLSVVVALEKKLAQEMEDYKVKCQAENKKPAIDSLAKQAATIAQKSVACQPSPDKDQCINKAACAILAPIPGLAGMINKDPELKKCAAEKGVPDCLVNLGRGIFDSVWTALTSVWDLGKLAVTASAEWLGIIKNSEAQSSEKAMMAQQASPGFLKQFAANPLGTMKKLANDMYESIKDSARNHYGCEKWSGAPYVSTCLKPMSTWDCGTCQQKLQVWCGVVGYALGEIPTAFITGGLLSGAKAGLKAAVTFSGGPAKKVSEFMAKTFPKASAEVAEAAGKVKTLAANGLTAAQKKVLDSWNAMANSKLTKTIAQAAAKTGVSTVTSIALKPVSVYLDALNKAFTAGANTVDNIVAKSAKAQAGAKIADQAMSATTAENGLVIESAPVVPVATVASTAQKQATAQAATVEVKQTAAVTKTGEGKATNVEAIEQAKYADDIAKYRQEPEYMELFKGAEVYPEHHKHLAMVIGAMEEAHPAMTKEAIRKKIQETLSSCKL